MEDIRIVSAIRDLPAPDPEFDLAKLLPARSPSAADHTHVGFETEEWCRAEDTRRGETAKHFDWERWPHVTMPEIEDYFAEMLEEFGAHGVAQGGPSAASATSMRSLRRNFLGATLKFIREHPTAPAAWITLTCTDWRYAGDDNCWDFRQFAPPQMFRAMLRISGVMTAPGYLIAYLHAQYSGAVFHVQFRGICAGDKLHYFQRLDKMLLDPANEPLRRDYFDRSFVTPSESKALDRVFRRHQLWRPAWLATTTQRITDLPVQISAMLPNGITPQIRRAERPSEPFHTGYLVWRENYQDWPLIVMSGVRLEGQRLVLFTET